MLDFYQKRKLRAILNSRITQGVLAVVAFIMLYNAFERFMIADTMYDRRVLVEQEAALLQTQKDQLESQVQYLRDERGLEAEMRRQFDIALPGEEVVVILEDPDAVVTEPVTEPEPENSWWPW